MNRLRQLLFRAPAQTITAWVQTGLGLVLLSSATVGVPDPPSNDGRTALLSGIVWLLLGVPECLPKHATRLAGLLRILSIGGSILFVAYLALLLRWR